MIDFYDNPSHAIVRNKRSTNDQQKKSKSKEELKILLLQLISKLDENSDDVDRRHIEFTETENRKIQSTEYNIHLHPHHFKKRKKHCNLHGVWHSSVAGGLQNYNSLII